MLFWFNDLYSLNHNDAWIYKQPGSDLIAQAN